MLFVVDRKDLDSQTTEEFNKFEAGSVDATDRTDLLVKQIQDKNRQLIITTIQKMANAVKNQRYSSVTVLYKLTVSPVCLSRHPPMADPGKFKRYFTCMHLRKLDALRCTKQRLAITY